MTSGILSAIFSFSSEAALYSSLSSMRSRILPRVSSCLCMMAACKSCQTAAPMSLLTTHYCPEVSEAGDYFVRRVINSCEWLCAPQSKPDLATVLWLKKNCFVPPLASRLSPERLSAAPVWASSPSPGWLECSCVHAESCPGLLSVSWLSVQTKHKSQMWMT